jgi:cell pole-organizing protein PopZ
MAMPTQVAQSIPSVPPTAETPAKKMFSDMNEFLNHTDSATKAGDSLLNTQAASTVTDSIKKLVDAKNVVSGVTSFSKSEAFGDIASQLMEPRLEKWLNENLPALVEKIVREEIKKIIPKE